jgi:hypothetical protein
MFFTINNKKYLSPEQLRSDTLMHAYFVIESYPMHASDTILDQFIQQQYKVTLKNLCIKLLLSLTFYKDKTGNLILMFKDPKYDNLARLITYGNGAIPGSKILQIALSN